MRPGTPDDGVGLVREKMVNADFDPREDAVPELEGKINGGSS